MNFSQEMNNLCKTFKTSYDDRIRFLGKNLHNVTTLKNESHKMINRFHRDHLSMARTTRNQLRNFTENLCDYVDHLLGRFKRDRMSYHRELMNGHNTFNHSMKELRNKRKNFFTDVKKEEQKFGQRKH